MLITNVNNFRLIGYTQDLICVRFSTPEDVNAALSKGNMLNYPGLSIEMKQFRFVQPNDDQEVQESKM